jgi:hypothetical protein
VLGYLTGISEIAFQYQINGTVWGSTITNIGFENLTNIITPVIVDILPKGRNSPELYQLLNLFHYSTYVINYLT